MFTLNIDGKQVRLLKLQNIDSVQEWSGAYSRHCQNWPEFLRELVYKDLAQGSFVISWHDYLRVFSSTCICVDSPQRAHYKITSAGANMKDKKDVFLSFSLEKPIDCSTHSFGIICEQQGNRIVTAFLPESTGRKFIPSNFNIMLIYFN